MKSNTEKFGKTPHQPSLWTRADALKVRADDPTTTPATGQCELPGTERRGVYLGHHAAA